jgi:hypothetical protein
MSMSLINLNVQSLFQSQTFNSMSLSMLIHSQFVFGPTKMVMSILQVKLISTYSQFVSFQIKLPICILLLVKRLVRPKEQLVPAYMPMFPVKRQVRSEEQFVPCLCLLLVKRQVRSKEQFAPIYML